LTEYWRFRKPLSDAQIFMDAKPLQGKVAVVTGAASPTGLGRAITLALIRAGARVAMVDVNRNWLDERVDEVRTIGGSQCALALCADVSDPDAADQAIQKTIDGLGGLHILINNAGLHHSGAIGSKGLDTDFWKISPEIWNRVIAVNLCGPFFLARAAVGHLLAQKWGRIIGVTTSMDTMYRKGGSPYGPSKAGHEAFIATIAQDLENTGVTANVLVPGGAANTNMIPASAPFDRAKLIQPEVMQAPVVWLASSASDGLNARRIIAARWDERLPIQERIAKATAPAAWPQLGAQAIVPNR
jgi:NAD(P)-dependent dehydrogenase (short-subunit alcohol dehydrogenase family)